MRVPRGVGLLVLVVMVSQGEVQAGMRTAGVLFCCKMLDEGIFARCQEWRDSGRFLRAVDLIRKCVDVCTKSEDSL